jgi:hypothetical protein
LSSVESGTNFGTKFQRPLDPRDNGRPSIVR